jgi:hypothetical protein
MFLYFSYNGFLFTNILQVRLSQISLAGIEYSSRQID